MGIRNGMRPVHPGEILGEELEKLGVCPRNNILNDMRH